MGRYDVTRRQLLAGLAGAGGLGAVVGTGTASIYSDEALFGGSSLSSGTLDLTVDWETADATGSSEGSLAVPVELSASDPLQTVDLSVSLPDHGGQNNPAAPWVRSECPNGEDLASALEVTLRYTGCSGNCVLFSGSLGEFAEGVPLDAGGDPSLSLADQRCLDPGETLDLELDVGVTNFDGRDETEFTLEFVGVQCRNGTGIDPFEGASDCGPAKPPDRGHGPDVSFVAFCSGEKRPIRPSLPRNEPGDDGPSVVFWETAVDVDYVVVKGANTMTIYDYRTVERTAGSATVGDPDAAVPAYEVEPGESARPCAVATSELGEIPGGTRQSIKLEYEDGGWEVERG